MRVDWEAYHMVAKADKNKANKSKWDEIMELWMVCVIKEVMHEGGYTRDANPETLSWSFKDVVKALTYAKKILSV